MMNELEIVQKQLELALNEIKSIKGRNVELLHDYIFEANRVVKKLNIDSVSNSLLSLDGKTVPVTFRVSKFEPKIDIDLSNDC